MNITGLVAGLLLVAGSAVSAGADDCSPRNLAACRSTNDLFWGPAQKSGRAVAKREFRNALTTFLRDAPKLYLGKTAFDPAQIASNALIGPGDHHDRVSGGGWFFDGFTPHDAQERGAVIFSADGGIRLVALLNVETDAAGPDPTAQDLNRYRLRLYGHDAPDAASVRLLQNWAGYTVKTQHRANPQANGSLAGTVVLTLENGQWQRRP